MKEYTGTRVLNPLRPGYASMPDALGVPVEPPINEYYKGVLPLETLPAPYWNWFISHISDNDNRLADQIADIYGEFNYILNDAGVSYSNTYSDLLKALDIIWMRDVNAEKNRAMAAEAAEATARASADTALSNRVTTIEGKVPSAASTTNQMSDKDWVLEQISLITSRYMTNASGGVFATRTALLAGPWYYQGVATTPSTNDYAIVTADESSGNQQWRYMYDGVAWRQQYHINETPFTTSQWNAINSGITATLRAKLEGLDTGTNYAAAITGLQTNINGKQNKIAAQSGSVGTLLLSPSTLGGEPGTVSRYAFLLSRTHPTIPEVLLAPTDPTYPLPNIKNLSEFALKADQNTFSGHNSFQQAVALPAMSAALTSTASSSRAATEAQVYSTAYAAAASVNLSGKQDVLAGHTETFIVTYPATAGGTPGTLDRRNVVQTTGNYTVGGIISFSQEFSMPAKSGITWVTTASSTKAATEKQVWDVFSASPRGVHNIRLITETANGSSVQCTFLFINDRTTSYNIPDLNVLINNIYNAGYGVWPKSLLIASGQIFVAPGATAAQFTAGIGALTTGLITVSPSGIVTEIAQSVISGFSDTTYII
jgi:hypothetical protein